MSRFLRRKDKLDVQKCSGRSKSASPSRWNQRSETSSSSSSLSELTSSRTTADVLANDPGACLNVRRNRNEARQLFDEFKDLCGTIEDASEGGRKPPFIKRMFDDFIKLLEEIQAETMAMPMLSSVQQSSPSHPGHIA
ncbi:hypothetical protein SCHPADRAFT_891941 [Schizopora paradoxa]|uniref:Uncharacterized protein n=1 Tax=Schizopora paradoxa TaxID=27342 RepID=A0A0H2RGR5_9AGAM|nr:hypothetical protein SCHPADRAFT_891941 [Schizopora paradoxa]